MVQLGGMNESEPTVSQYMTLEPATADEGLLLVDAEERMALDNIRHLVVLDRMGHVVGVLSHGDIALALSLPGADRKKLRVRDAMSDNPYVCGPSVRISDVALAMESHRWGCAIVLEGDDVIGVFTTTDALRALRELASGMLAAPAIHPTHLPPLQPSANAPRRLRMRHHHPLAAGRTSMFSPGG
jgi:acetoin utilization protein AcuB